MTPKNFNLWTAEHFIEFIKYYRDELCTDSIGKLILDSLIQNAPATRRLMFWQNSLDTKNATTYVALAHVLVNMMRTKFNVKYQLDAAKDSRTAYLRSLENPTARSLTKTAAKDTKKFRANKAKGQNTKTSGSGLRKFPQKDGNNKSDKTSKSETDSSKESKSIGEIFPAAPDAEMLIENAKRSDSVDGSTLTDNSPKAKPAVQKNQTPTSMTDDVDEHTSSMTAEDPTAFKLVKRNRSPSPTKSDSKKNDSPSSSLVRALEAASNKFAPLITDDDDEDIDNHDNENWENNEEVTNEDAENNTNEDTGDNHDNDSFGDVIEEALGQKWTPTDGTSFATSEKGYDELLINVKAGYIDQIPQSDLVWFAGETVQRTHEHAKETKEHSDKVKVIYTNMGDYEQHIIDQTEEIVHDGTIHFESKVKESMKELNDFRSKTLGDMAKNQRTINDLTTKAVEEVKSSATKEMLTGVRALSGHYATCVTTLEEKIEEADKIAFTLKELHNITSAAIGDANKAATSQFKLEASIQVLEARVQAQETIIDNTQQCLKDHRNMVDKATEVMEKMASQIKDLEQSASGGTPVPGNDATGRQESTEPSQAQPLKENDPSIIVATAVPVTTPTQDPTAIDLTQDDPSDKPATKPSTQLRPWPYFTKVQIKLTTMGKPKETREVWILNWMRKQDGQNYYYGEDAVSGKYVFYDSEITRTIGALVKPAAFQDNFGYNNTNDFRDFKTVESDLNRKSGKTVHKHHNHVPPTQAPLLSYVDHQSQAEPEEREQYSNPSQSSYNPYLYRSLQDCEYRYPKENPAIIRITEYRLLDHAKTNITAIVSDKDSLRNFYEEIKECFQPYNIPMREWYDITPESTVFSTTERNCDNYENVIKIMNRVLFKVLKIGRDKFFPEDPVLRSYHLQFQDEQDGSSYLKQIILDGHESLQHLSRSSTTATDALSIPTFTHSMHLLEWLNSVKQHVKDVRSSKHTPYFMMKFVKEQLGSQDRFNEVVKKMEKVLKDEESDSGWLDQKYHLSNLGSWILNEHPREEQNKLAGPLRFNPAPSIRTMAIEDEGDSDPTIHAMTRSQTRGRGFDRQKPRWEDQQGRRNDTPRNRRDNDQQHKKQPDKTNIKGLPPPRDTVCKGCGGYGHNIADGDYCPKAGSWLHLSQYFQQLPERQHNKVLQEYADHAHKAHLRYKAKYQKRGQQRYRINRCAMTPEDRAAVTSFLTEDDPDFHFGSLDETLVDDTEPFLAFDPEDNDCMTELNNYIREHLEE